MPRRRRIAWAGGIFHVMNRGVDREPIFFGDIDRVEFGRRLTDVHERFGVEVLAYCLMTNHFHLLLRLCDANLSAAMQRLEGVYVRHVNDRLGRDGPLFRGRFTSIPVLTDAHLLRSVRYIHRNPLDLPDVRRVNEFRWSSMRSYLGHRRPPHFLNLEPVLGAFEHPQSFLEFHGDGQTAPVPIATLDELDTVIDQELMVAGVDAEGEARPPIAAKTVRTLVLERSGSQLAPLGAGAFPSAPARHAAAYRARAKARVDRRLDRLVDSVLAAIAA